MTKKNTEIVFDVTNDDSPVVVGLDVKQYTITDNMSAPPRIMMKRPSDNATRSLETYLSKENPLRARLRLLIVPTLPPTLTSSAMLGKARKPNNLRPLTLAKRIHSMTHAHPEQVIRICKGARWLTETLENAIRTTSATCDTCAMTGPPAPSKKISLNHINEDFNN